MSSDRLQLDGYRILNTLRPYRFERVYGGWNGRQPCWRPTLAIDLAGSTETSLRATADLDYPGTGRNADLIKEPRRFLGEFLGLLLQTPLLERTVPKKVLIA